LLIAPLEMLVRQPHRLAAEEVKELLHTMHGNAMRLLKLINDLLDLVRLDSNRMQVAREPVEIYEFLRGLVNSVKKIAADKHLKLELCAPADLGTVMVDRDKLERIILNLVFNSVKFTHGGGRIELQAERKNGELMFHVRDTGVGIAAEQLPFVFDRFWQADTSSQRKYQGAGIGLALVKELTEVQGGKVQATSELGKGTTITVLLPYLPAEKSAAAAPSPAPAVMPEPVKSPDAEWLSSLYRRAELFPSLTSLQETLRPVEIQWRTRLPRLLVADDEPDMLRVLKTQLGAYFEILEAVDGQQAVDKATQFLPDVVHFDFKENSKTKDQYAKDYDEGVGWDDTAGGGGGDGGGRSACGGSGEDGMGAAVDSGGGTGGVSGGVSGGEVWGACCWGLYGSRSGGMGPRLEI
jgi:two-component sensor histidine kinase